MIPGSVGAAGVPWPAGVGLPPAEVGLPSGVSPGVASEVALGLATGGFFRDVGGIVSLPMF